MARLLPDTELRREAQRDVIGVAGRVFATLDLARKHALLRLSWEEQRVLRHAQPAVVGRAPGRAQGWTRIRLESVDPWIFQELLVSAWRRLAPRRAKRRWARH